MKNRKPAENFSLKSFVVILLIIIIGSIAYINTFNVPFQFDDQYHIVENQDIKSLDTFKDFNYWLNIHNRPVSEFSFALNYSISGNDGWSYHLFNLLIHLLSGCFVFLFIQTMFRSKVLKEGRYSSFSGEIAFFVSLVFIAHPIQTQAVTYIVQRMTSLASMFYLASVLFYVHARLKHTKQGFIPMLLVFYGLSVFSAILALLSKQSAVSLPVAILLVEFLFIRNKEGKPYYLLLGIALFSFIAVVLIFFLSNAVPNETSGISRSEYLYTQFSVYLKYWQLMFMPVSQNLDYNYSVSVSFWDIRTIVALILNILIIVFGFFIRKRNPLISFAVFWFYIVLSVESGIIPIRDVIAEHRLYLPILSAGFILSVILLSLFRNKRKMYLLVSGLIIVVLCVATISRNKVWQDELSLWKDTVKKSPEKVRAITNLGKVYKDRGNYPLALREFDKAIELQPNYITYTNRAEVHFLMGSYGASQEDYTNAIKLDPSPAQTYYHRGLCFLNLQEYYNAYKDFETAINIRHTFYEAYIGRGFSKQYRGDLLGAMKDFTKAIRAEPNNPLGYYNRANVHKEIADYQKAFRDYSVAIKLNPDFAEAYFKKGILHFENRESDLAIEAFSKVIELIPGFSEGFNNRGLAYQFISEFDKSIQDFNKAIELNPGNTSAYINRANSYFELGEMLLAAKDIDKAKSLGATINPSLELRIKNAL